MKNKPHANLVHTLLLFEEVLKICTKMLSSGEAITESKIVSCLYNEHSIGMLRVTEK